MKPPVHVAIIMDGNGRWGLKKKKFQKLRTSNWFKDSRKNN